MIGPIALRTPILRSLVGLVLMSLTALAFPASPLLNYIKRPDSSYSWKAVSQSQLPDGTALTTLDLTSQTWRGIVWKHHLSVLKPAAMRPHPTPLLFITGSYNPQEAAPFALAAAAAHEPAFILWDVPNQPLFEGRTEDALIAYTFGRYIETGDPDWPLLFPMAKAAVRAMDAAQAFARREWKTSIPGFVVSGASKRGWTTWLTAAADPRALGIAPMVYDNLDLARQMPHQVATWGRYSEQIADYTRMGLQQQMGTPAGKRLSAMVDPYTYRASILIPKLLINGTNDRYWPVDSANLYFPDLVGPKCLLYVPNSGHGLEDLGRVSRSLIAFWRHVSDQRPLPPLGWSFAREPAGSGLALTIRPGAPAKAVRIWRAAARTRDFRQANWTASPMKGAKGVFTSTIPAPAHGYTAAFGEVEYNEPGIGSYTLSTEVRILGPNR